MSGLIFKLQQQTSLLADSSIKTMMQTVKSDSQSNNSGGNWEKKSIQDNNITHEHNI